MLVVTSPDKKLDFAEDVTRSGWTIPAFLEDSQILTEAAIKVTRLELLTLMKIRDNLAELH